VGSDDPELRRREGRYRGWAQGLAEAFPEIAETLVRGRFADLEALGAAPAPAPEPSRAERRAERELRRAWTDVIRPAWRRALESRSVEGAGESEAGFERHLIALEETQHFREAAESCGISQPSLSVQIKTLEDTLGLILVERGRGPVRLTLAGREVARRAREILDASQGILDLSVTLKSALLDSFRLRDWQSGWTGSQASHHRRSDRKAKANPEPKAKVNPEPKAKARADRRAKRSVVVVHGQARVTDLATHTAGSLRPKPGGAHDGATSVSVVSRCLVSTPGTSARSESPRTLARVIAGSLAT
jgi:DNA-binding transcriptional ArsR family regulator